MSHSVWGDWKITKDRARLVWVDPKTQAPNHDYDIIVSDGKNDAQGEVARLEKSLPQSFQRDEALGKLGVIFAEIKDDEAGPKKFVMPDLIY